MDLIIVQKLFIEYQDPKAKMINKTILSIKYYCVAHNLPFADPGFAQVLPTTITPSPTYSEERSCKPSEPIYARGARSSQDRIGVTPPLYNGSASCPPRNIL